MIHHYKEDHIRFDKVRETEIPGDRRKRRRKAQKNRADCAARGKSRNMADRVKQVFRITVSAKESLRERKKREDRKKHSGSMT